MGRKKIEIQPIVHERNRSVTFAKRKSGLFKKAYELGVLCSVDVAVIIFEERPGHGPKLYQYCSKDIHDIVQRHIRFNGEKDTRNPVDFSGVSGGKVDDAGEGDDDDVEDDEAYVPRAKRRSNGKVKTAPTPTEHRTAMSPPPAVPLHVPTLPQSGSSSAHPISSARDSGNLTRNPPPPPYPINKKQRTADTHNRLEPRSRSPPPPRDDYPPYNPISYRTQIPQQQHYAPYAPFTQPQHQNPSFLPNSYEYSPPLRSANRNSYPLAPPPPTRLSLNTPAVFSPRSSYNDSGGGMYGVMRQSPQYHAYVPPPPPPQSISISTTQRMQQDQGTASDLLALFSGGDASSDGRQTAPGPGAGAFGEFDWPVHTPGPGGQGGSPTVPNHGPPSSSSPSSPPGSGHGHWLDFLSNSSTGPGGAPLDGPGRRNSTTTLSWERGERSDDGAEPAGGRTSLRLLTSPLAGSAAGSVGPTSAGRVEEDKETPVGEGRISPGRASEVGEEGSVSSRGEMKGSD